MLFRVGSKFLEGWLKIILGVYVNLVSDFFTVGLGLFVVCLGLA